MTAKDCSYGIPARFLGHSRIGFPLCYSIFTLFDLLTTPQWRPTSDGMAYPKCLNQNDARFLRKSRIGFCLSLLHHFDLLTSQ